MTLKLNLSISAVFINTEQTCKKIKKFPHLLLWFDHFNVLVKVSVGFLRFPIWHFFIFTVLCLKELGV